MSNDQAAILHPKAGKKVPHRFIATGTVCGDRAKGVRAELVRGDKVIGAARLLSFRPAPSQDGPSRWMVLFDKVPDGVYQLEVIGLDEVGSSLDGGKAMAEATVSNSVRGLLVTIDYPADQQDVSDQRDDLICYGMTDTNIATVTAGDTPAQSIVTYLEPGYWTAEFPPLGAGLTLPITVKDVDNDQAQITVYT